MPRFVLCGGSKQPKQPQQRSPTQLQREKETSRDAENIQDASEREEAERNVAKQAAADELGCARAHYVLLAEEIEQTEEQKDNIARAVEEARAGREETAATEHELATLLATIRHEAADAGAAEEAAETRWDEETLALQHELDTFANETQTLKVRIVEEEHSLTWQQGEESHVSTELQHRREVASENRFRARSEEQMFTDSARRFEARNRQLSQEAECMLQEIEIRRAATAELRTELDALVDDASVENEDLFATGCAQPASDQQIRGTERIAVSVQDIWKLQAEARESSRRVQELQATLDSRKTLANSACRVDPAPLVIASLPSPPASAVPMSAIKPSSETFKDEMKARAAIRASVCSTTVAHADDDTHMLSSLHPERGGSHSPMGHRHLRETAYILSSSPSPVRSPTHVASSTPYAESKHITSPPASQLVAENRTLRAEAESLRRSLQQAKAHQEALTREEVRAGQLHGQVANVSRASLRGVMREQLRSSRELLAEMRRDVSAAAERLQCERHARETLEQRLMARESEAGWNRVPPAPASWQGLPSQSSADCNLLLARSGGSDLRSRSLSSSSSAGM